METTLYKRDASGFVRVWTMELDGSRYRTISGLHNGNIFASAWTDAKPNTLRDATQQAEFEAKAEIKKKLERDYHETTATIDQPRYFKPMLAHKYETFPGPCFTQPKLDGIRCIARDDGLWSRNGKPILGAPHILQALQPSFEDDPDLILDGELYNHDLKDDFNKIVSAVKKQKPTPEDLTVSRQHIQYHVYDMPSDGGNFSDRLWALKRTLAEEHPHLHRVWTVGPINEQQMDDYYGWFIEQGYEGQIIRLDAPYEQKRSKHLLKRKEFLDAEFPVLRIEEGIGNWAGYAKRVVCQLPDGREFGAGIKGDQAFTRQLLTQSPHSATIRYFSLTPDGIPRFPVAVAWHDNERL